MFIRLPIPSSGVPVYTSPLLDTTQPYPVSPKIGSVTTSELIERSEPYIPSSLSPEKSFQPLFITRVPPSFTSCAPTPPFDIVYLQLVFPIYSEDICPIFIALKFDNFAA